MMKLFFSISDSVPQEERQSIQILSPQILKSIPAKGSIFFVKTKIGEEISVRTEKAVPFYDRSNKNTRSATGIRLIVIPTKKK